MTKAEALLSGRVVRESGSTSSANSCRMQRWQHLRCHSYIVGSHSMVVPAALFIERQGLVQVAICVIVYLPVQIAQVTSFSEKKKIK